MFGSMVIGIILGAGFMWLVNFTQKNNLVLIWWQWLVTVLGFAYAAFVLETIQAFLNEGAGQGAFVIGLILGVVAIIWGVLLARYVVNPKKAAE